MPVFLLFPIAAGAHSKIDILGDDHRSIANKTFELWKFKGKIFTEDELIVEAAKMAAEITGNVGIPLKVEENISNISFSQAAEPVDPYTLKVLLVTFAFGQQMLHIDNPAFNQRFHVEVHVKNQDQIVDIVVNILDGIQKAIEKNIHFLAPYLSREVLEKLIQSQLKTRKISPLPDTMNYARLADHSFIGPFVKALKPFQLISLEVLLHKFKDGVPVRRFIELLAGYRNRPKFKERTNDMDASQEYLNMLLALVLLNYVHERELKEQSQPCELSLTFAQQL